MKTASLGFFRQLVDRLKPAQKSSGIQGINALGSDAKEIVIKDFFDLDLDVVGVYALGHHTAAAFLAAVRKQEPNIPVRQEQVRRTWIKLHGQGFEELSSFQEGAQAATILELYE